MKTYRVTWTIDIDAANPREAAQLALDIQRQHDSIATCFEVTEPFGGPVIKTHSIDLGEAA